MNSGWGDDFHLFLQRVKLMRQPSLTTAPPSAGPGTTPSNTMMMEMSVDEEGEDAECISQFNDKNPYLPKPLNSKEKSRSPEHKEALFLSPLVGSSDGMVKVTVGIDEDLRLILEMDPSIVDLDGQWAHQPTRVLGLPPISGG